MKGNIFYLILSASLLEHGNRFLNHFKKRKKSWDILIILSFKSIDLLRTFNASNDENKLGLTSIQHSRLSGLEIQV